MTLLRDLKSALAQPFNFSLFSLSLFALGCGPGSLSTAPMAGPQLRGSVHGGQQPVSGATIRLYAAGTSGYGAGAFPLLTAPVSTDANGAFSITGQYACPSASSQLYIVATGGNPGLGTPTNNASLALMAALGPCSLHGSQYTLDPNSFISINEVTTVASVYALAGFIDPSTSQIGASASNSIGIANAFKTVSNLVNIATGQSLATTPPGNGTAPQAEINTLADIIATCVNSSGSGPECAALFAAATPSGGSAPTNTIQALFNIATHPAQQVGALYALFSPTSPFQPTLPSAPNDWTIHVTYTASGSSQTGIAVDGSGNVWIANNFTSSVTELATDGTILSGPAGYTGGGLNRPTAIAIDPLGNAWLTNDFGGLTKLNNVGTPLSGSTGFPVCGVGLAIDGFGNIWCGALGHVSKIDNNGNLLSGTGYPGGGLGTPIGASVDPLNNVWFTSTTAFNVSNVAKFTNVGVPLSGTTGYTATGLTNAWSIANDSAGNTWVTNNGFFSNVFRFASDGTNLSGPNGYTGGGLTNPLAIAIDGAGNAWVTSDSISTSSGSPVAYNSVVQFGSDGTLLSGATGYSLSTNGIAGGLPRGIAIDGSGNVWVAASGTNVVELVGAATPVVTPLSVGVKNNTLGTRP
ncbi:MAG TPA: hypothetical protein VNY74_04485 [Edaphobacter sp.]|nr:hypothetical protein [Edaphobacter sp.]